MSSKIADVIDKESESGGWCQAVSKVNFESHSSRRLVGQRETLNTADQAATAG